MACIFFRLDKHLYMPFWDDCFRLAVAFGWKPMGTLQIHPLSLEEDPEWSGSYFPPEGQTVLDKDARCLGKCLFRAIDAISRRTELTDEQLRVVEECCGVEGVTRIRMLAIALEVADYANAGGFIIK